MNFFFVRMTNVNQIKFERSNQGHIWNFKSQTSKNFDWLYMIVFSSKKGIVKDLPVE